MGLSKQAVDTAYELISQAQSALLVSHIRPDGDAVGSLLAFGLSLQAAGKRVQMVLEDGVPASFRHLAGAEQVVQKQESEADVVVVLDCSDFLRVGNTIAGFPPPHLNIDHHVTNLGFATVNLVDTTAVATTEILAGLLPLLGLPITQPVAEALLTGLITDSLGFRTSNMTPKALRVAADLMEKGADLPDLYFQALIRRSFEATRFWGAGLSQLKKENGLVWTTLTMADRKSAGYSGRDDADLVNILSSIDEAAVALIFVEQPNGSVKVSWRSQPEIDVTPVALSYGGGGHPAAAGAEIPGDLEDVKSSVLQATRALLNREKSLRK